jgi:hypothetical protein
MKRVLISLLIAASVTAVSDTAYAFWVAHGWRDGGIAGGLRPPLVARRFFFPSCQRCAPVFPEGAAGAAFKGDAAGAATAARVLAPQPGAPGAFGAPPPPESPASAPAPAPAKTAAASAADQCASGLSSDSKLIYDASVKNMKSIATLRNTVTARTRALVFAGKLSRSTAKAAAEKAGTCLRLLAKS